MAAVYSLIVARAFMFPFVFGKIKVTQTTVQRKARRSLQSSPRSYLKLRDMQSSGLNEQSSYAS